MTMNGLSGLCIYYLCSLNCLALKLKPRLHLGLFLAMHSPLIGDSFQLCKAKLEKGKDNDASLLHLNQQQGKAQGGAAGG